MNSKTWPEIHLEAVNKQAAFMLSRKGCDPAPIISYEKSIRSDLETVDRAIRSISGQLQTRFDPDWAPGARRALKGYYTQRNSLKKMLHAASEALSVVRTRIKENEKTARALEIESAHEKAREANQSKRMERINAANEQSQRTYVIFKRMVAELVGREKCIELLQAASKEANP